MSDQTPPLPEIVPPPLPTPEVLPPLPPPPAGFKGKDTVLSGFLFGLLLHLFQIPIGVLSAGIGTLAIGISQLLYVVPFYLGMRKAQPMRAKGLLICAGITFLLNAACFGVFMVLLSNTSFH